MKFVLFIFKAIGFVAGMGALALVGAALAGPIGWPFELFASWPYLIAALGVCGAIVAGLCHWPRLATTVFAGAVLLIALAMASPGDLTRSKAPPINTSNIHLVWGNMFLRETSATKLIELADTSNQAILAGGEMPRGRAWQTSPQRQKLKRATAGGLIVEGCEEEKRVFETPARADGQLSNRTFAIAVECSDFVLYAVHLTNPLWRNDVRFVRRGEELGELAAIIKAENKPIVVIGDFNTPPNSAHLVRFLKAANLAKTSCGGRWLPTWRPRQARTQFKDGNPLTGIPIDHLLTRDIQVVSCVVGADFGSDHLPLIVELKKPAPVVLPSPR